MSFHITRVYGTLLSEPLTNFITLTVRVS